MTALRVNLGCGDKRLDGYVNVDLRSGDVEWDLNTRWPFEDGTVDEVLMDHVLEHLDLDHCYTEAARVLKAGGVWRVMVPHGCSPFAWRYGHVRFYSLWTFVDLATPPHYGLARAFDTALLRLGFRGVRALRWMEPIANIAPFAWECLGLPMFEIEWTAKRRDRACA